ncbi:hypothetical protein BCR33DRAFT_711069, partial [Rhizoclosmatium globosum]
GSCLYSADALQYAGSVQKVLLLDPSAPVELNPDDGKDGFEFLLDRTKELRVQGFTGRHLGPIQMTVSFTECIIGSVGAYHFW